MAPSQHPRTQLPAWTFLAVSLLCAACGSRSALDEPPADNGTGGAATMTSSGGATVSSGGSTTTGGTAATGGDGGAPNDPVISASPDSQYETTTDLKAGNDGLVVVVWVAYPPNNLPFVGYAFSNDGGVSFSPPGRIDCPGGLRAAEPTLGIGPTQEVFVTWLGLKDVDESTGRKVFLARAAPGTTTFGTPSVVAASVGYAFVTQPRLGVTEMGTLFVTLHRQAANFSARFARSTDGITWKESLLPALESTGPAGTNVASPCALADGAPAGRFGFAYTAYPQTALLLTKDEGLTFLDAKHGVKEGGKEPRCAVSATRIYAATSGADHVLVSESHGGDVTLWTLGQTGSPVLTGAPAIAMGEDDMLTLAYQTHVGDDDPAGKLNVVRFTSAKNYWHATLPIHADPMSPGYMGRYIGLATKGQTLFLSYPDASSGFSHIAVHRMALP